MHFCVFLTVLLMILDRAQWCKHTQMCETCPWPHLPSCSGSAVKHFHSGLPVSVGRGYLENNTHECTGPGCVSLEWGSWIPSLAHMGIFCCVVALAPRNVRSQNGNGWHCLGLIPANAFWIEALFCCPFSVTSWGELSKIGHCYAWREPCSLSSLGFQVNELWR